MDTKEKTVSHLNNLFNVDRYVYRDIFVIELMQINIRCREPPIHFQEIREVINTSLIWAFNARVFFNLKNKFYEN